MVRCMQSLGPAAGYVSRNLKNGSEVRSGRKTNRNLTETRRLKIESFRILNEAEPESFGDIGSQDWLNALLNHFAEPKVLTVDNVKAWLLKNEHIRRQFALLIPPGKSGLGLFSRDVGKKGASSRHRLRSKRQLNLSNDPLSSKRIKQENVSPPRSPVDEDPGPGSFEVSSPEPLMKEEIPGPCSSFEDGQVNGALNNPEEPIALSQKSFDQVRSATVYGDWTKPAEKQVEDVNCDLPKNPLSRDSNGSAVYESAKESEGEAADVKILPNSVSTSAPQQYVSIFGVPVPIQEDTKPDIPLYPFPGINMVIANNNGSVSLYNPPANFEDTPASPGNFLASRYKELKSRNTAVMSNETITRAVDENANEDIFIDPYLSSVDASEVVVTASDSQADVASNSETATKFEIVEVEVITECENDAFIGLPFLPPVEAVNAVVPVPDPLDDHMPPSDEAYGSDLFSMDAVASSPGPHGNLMLENGSAGSGEMVLASNGFDFGLQLIAAMRDHCQSPEYNHCLPFLGFLDFMYSSSEYRNYVAVANHSIVD